MHLYRIMTDVCSAPAVQSQRTPSRRGIATVWIKADSDQHALERGRNVISERHYARTGELTMFREENTHVEADSPITPIDGMAAGYTAIKTEALRRGDGIFEIWFPTVRP